MPGVGASGSGAPVALPAELSQKALAGEQEIRIQYSTIYSSLQASKEQGKKGELGQIQNTLPIGNAHISYLLKYQTGSKDKYFFSLLTLNFRLTCTRNIETSWKTFTWMEKKPVFFSFPEKEVCLASTGTQTYFFTLSPARTVIGEGNTTSSPERPSCLHQHSPNTSSYGNV